MSARVRQMDGLTNEVSWMCVVTMATSALVFSYRRESRLSTLNSLSDVSVSSGVVLDKKVATQLITKSVYS